MLWKSIVILMVTCCVSAAFAWVPTDDSDLVAWYKADAGVVGDGSGGVSVWQDQSGNGMDLATVNGTYLNVATNPLLETATINGNSHSVVNFNNNGPTGLYQWVTDADYPDLFAMTEMSVYIVANNQGGYAGGYGQGTDPDFSMFECYSSNGGFAALVERASRPQRGIIGTRNPWAGVKSGTMYQNWDYFAGTATDAGGGAKALGAWLNGELLGTGTAGLAYESAGTHASIGGRRLGDYWKFAFNGSIAEIILFDSANEAQMANVDAYLVDKYGVVPEPATLALLGVGLAFVRRRK